MAKGGTKVHHQDFHFAVDSGKEMLDKVRRDYIKHWFSGEVPLGGAALDFGEQKIGAFVSPRNKKKKAIKKKLVFVMKPSHNLNPNSSHNFPFN